MKKHMGTALVLALWLGLSLWAWLKPAEGFSDAERRGLAQFPEVGTNFAEEFGQYAADQFPLRQELRGVKALFGRYVLGELDNNGIYVAEGSAAKMLYPVDGASVENAAARFQELYDLYLADSGKILFAVVPDKGTYLGRLAASPEEYVELLENRLSWAEFAHISGLLSAESYYRTDTHWRQETLVPVAEELARALGTEIGADFTEHTALEEFQGVYAGQAALPLEGDEIRYLTWPGWEDCRFTTVDAGEGALYDFEKLSGRDPYDFFLSGGVAVGTIENPHAASDRELIVFRDSFGSSLVPLLVPGYARITLIDTRYIAPDMVGGYVNFEGKDVLLLYSTLLLGDSSALRKPMEMPS